MLIAVRRQRGLTLVEIAVVITILAVAIAMGMPSYHQWLRNTQIRNAAESIQNGLQQARNEAVRLNRTTRFSLVALTDSRVMDDSCALSDAGPSWVVSLASPASKCGTAPSLTTDPMILASRAAGDGSRNVAVLAVDAAGAAASQVSFNGFGQVARGTTPIARIDIAGSPDTDGDRKLRIVIGNGGGVRLCDPAVSATTDPRKC